MNEKEYERLKRQIREECAEKLKALDLVWQMAKAGKSNENSPRKVGRKGEVLELVRAVLPNLSDKFTQRLVTDAIRQRNPDLGDIKRASVSSALRRLAGDGEIVVVEPGAGKRPSTYRRR